MTNVETKQRASEGFTKNFESFRCFLVQKLGDLLYEGLYYQKDNSDAIVETIQRPDVII